MQLKKIITIIISLLIFYNLGTAQDSEQKDSTKVVKTSEYEVPELLFVHINYSTNKTIDRGTEFKVRILLPNEERESRYYTQDPNSELSLDYKKGGWEIYKIKGFIQVDYQNDLINNIAISIIKEYADKGFEIISDSSQFQGQDTGYRTYDNQLTTYTSTELDKFLVFKKVL